MHYLQAIQDKFCPTTVSLFFRPFHYADRGLKPRILKGGDTKKKTTVVKIINRQMATKGGAGYEKDIFNRYFYSHAFIPFYL